MGDFQIKDGTGSLFKVYDKGGEKHPDYNGSAKIGGKEYYLSGWIKTAKSGKQYLSLSIQEKGKQKKAEKPQPKADNFDDFGDSDLPF